MHICSTFFKNEKARKQASKTSSYNYIEMNNQSYYYRPITLPTSSSSAHASDKIQQDDVDSVHNMLTLSSSRCPGGDAIENKMNNNHDVVVTASLSSIECYIMSPKPIRKPSSLQFDDAMTDIDNIDNNKAKYTNMDIFYNTE